MATATVSQSVRRSARKSRRVTFGPLFLLIERHLDADQIIAGDQLRESLEQAAKGLNKSTRSNRFVVREADADSLRFYETFRSAKGGAV